MHFLKRDKNHELFSRLIRAFKTCILLMCLSVKWWPDKQSSLTKV